MITLTRTPSGRTRPPRPDLRRSISRDLPLKTGIGALTVMVWHHRGRVAVDRSLLHGYLPSRSTTAFRVVRVVTEVGSPAVVIAMALVAAGYIWRTRRSWVESAVCIAAPGIAGVTETLAKVIVARPRPITAAFTGESGNGFPSGHATGFAALLIILALVLPSNSRQRRRSVALALVVSALEAISRVVVGAHYPTDVIAGMALGVLIADVTWIASSWLENIGFRRSNRVA